SPAAGAAPAASAISCLRRRAKSHTVDGRSTPQFALKPGQDALHGVPLLRWSFQIVQQPLVDHEIRA
ncbi:hypothetical protein ACFSL4_34270, partial [Streptomyces caeni]